jgi:hypothetical protein
MNISKKEIGWNTVFIMSRGTLIFYGKLISKET